MNYRQQISAQATVIWKINKVHDNYIYTWYDILTQSPVMFIQEGLQRISRNRPTECFEIIWFDYWQQSNLSPLVSGSGIAGAVPYVSDSLYFFSKILHMAM